MVCLIKPSFWPHMRQLSGPWSHMALLSGSSLMWLMFSPPQLLGLEEGAMEDSFWLKMLFFLIVFFLAVVFSCVIRNFKT